MPRIVRYFVLAVGVGLVLYSSFGILSHPHIDVDAAARKAYKAENPPPTRVEQCTDHYASQFDVPGSFYGLEKYCGQLDSAHQLDAKGVSASFDLAKATAVVKLELDAMQVEEDCIEDHVKWFGSWDGTADREEASAYCDRLKQAGRLTAQAMDNWKRAQAGWEVCIQQAIDVATARGVETTDEADQICKRRYINLIPKP